MIPESLNDNLFFNLDRASLLMRRRLLDSLGTHQVSPEQWEILQFIDNQEGTPQNKLTDLTMKDKGNISRTIARMVRNGWICRQLVKSRGVQLRLTSEGRQIKNSLPSLMSHQVRRILAPLEKEERGELIYTLKKLRILLGDDAI